MTSKGPRKAKQSISDAASDDPDLLTPAEIEALREDKRRTSARLKVLIARRKAEEAKKGGGGEEVAPDGPPDDGRRARGAVAPIARISEHELEMAPRNYGIC